MNISSKSIRGALGLTKRRDALLLKLEALEETIAARFSELTGTPAKVATQRGRKPGSKAISSKPPVSKASVIAARKKVAVSTSAKGANKRGKRGALKDQIIATLKAAGSKGASVKDISEKLGVKAANVYVWFGTTGKTVGVEKISPGTYRLK